MARISAGSEADVVEAVRAAREAKRTLEIVGRGTKRGLGRPIECDDVLDLSGLSGISKYEPDELVITALAGTPVAEIEAALAEKNQRLGFEPADWGPLFGSPANSATIGGALAADTSGSAAIRYGRARDHLLGFRAVNGLGEAYKAGGRVVKNVTGFDLPKLMCGAMGTLGPLTEVTLRVFPKPAQSIGFVWRNLAPADGLGVLRRVWSSPLEATGLAYVSNAAASVLPGNPGALIRLEGSASSLKQMGAMLRTLLPGHDSEEIGDSDQVLHTLSTGLAFADSSHVWRIHLPPARAEEFIAALDRPLWWADWAGSLLWLAAETEADVRGTAHQFEGRAVLMRAPEAERRRTAVFEPENAARAQLSRQVKAAFDPLRLFNPGQMWEGV
jgi:glycolate oxidase FAD binding subunit